MKKGVRVMDIEHNTIEIKNPKFYIFKKIWTYFKNHKEEINAITTLILVIVSIGLILVTVCSTVIANNLGKIEIYLAVQKEKQETMEQINLAENLLLETLQNQNYANNELIPFLEQKKDTEVIFDVFKITRLQQAKEMVNFGSQEIRFQLDNYLDIINLIKDDLEEMRQATRNRDTKIRDERMLSALQTTNIFLNEKSGLFELEKFIKDVKNYIIERNKHYQNIDKELENDLSLLLE